MDKRDKKLLEGVVLETSKKDYLNFKEMFTEIFERRLTESLHNEVEGVQNSIFNEGMGTEKDYVKGVNVSRHEGEEVFIGDDDEVDDEGLEISSEDDVHGDNFGMRGENSEPPSSVHVSDVEKDRHEAEEYMIGDEDSINSSGLDEKEDDDDEEEDDEEEDDDDDDDDEGDADANEMYTGEDSINVVAKERQANVAKQRMKTYLGAYGSRHETGKQKPDGNENMKSTANKQ